MRDKMNKNISDNKNKDAVLSFRDFFEKMKKYFIPWLIIAAIIAGIIFGYNAINHILNGTISTTINFSFDGIEAGLDPSGNKFDAELIKSENSIKESLKELNINNADEKEVYSNITISGLVPDNVIDRIIEYTPIYDSENIVSTKNIQDTTYYPTQYSITINCHKAGLSKKECVSLLNKLTEKYNDYFINSYGYNNSLEDVIKAIDYKEYDYIDAVSVFDSSLNSLQNYINEIAVKDSTRFRSEKTGYTFADLSKSIETLRTEDLDMVSSYLTFNNITKDKKTLIANYKFKIEELARLKKIYSERLDALNESISTYEKNSILIFGNATNGTNTALNQSSDTYDNLISEKVLAQTNLSSAEQNMTFYNDRISSLEGKTKQTGSTAVVEEDLNKINDKIDLLIKTVNDTSTEYYEEVIFSNAYTVLKPASSSFLSNLKNLIKESADLFIAVELLLASGYIIFTLSKVFLPEKTFLKKIKKQTKSKGV